MAGLGKLVKAGASMLAKNADEVIDTARKAGGGKDNSLLERVQSHVRAATTEATEGQKKIEPVTKSQRAYKQGQNKAGAAGVAAGSTGTFILMDIGGDIVSVPSEKAATPEKLKEKDIEIIDKKEVSEFEKAFSEAFKAGEESFVWNGREYAVELKAGDRTMKAGGGKIVSFLAKLAAKQADEAVEAGAKAAKAKKAKMPEQDLIDDEIKSILDDPQRLESMSADEYQEMVDVASPNLRAKLMGDDVSGAATNETVSMMKQMEPEDVAENLSYFNTLDEIRTYAKDLNPNETRRFVNSINADDEELFEGFADYIKTLGPREPKMHGGEMGMKPDEEMEEDYVDYILNEVLSAEEYDYLDEQLSKDDKLSVLFDKVILSSSEFTGEGEVDGPGNGTSDEIPARLSDGEFVFTKKAVEIIGADKLQKMMEEAEAEYDDRDEKAEGGLFTNPYDQATSYTTFDPSLVIDTSVTQSMLGANQMPSLRPGKATKY